jgi:hypothetical protein
LNNEEKSTEAPFGVAPQSRVVHVENSHWPDFVNDEDINDLEVDFALPFFDLSSKDGSLYTGLVSKGH